MKVSVMVAAVFGLTLAEPPLSNSYLPPPVGQGAGYPHGSQSSSGPQVVAARSLDVAGHGSHGAGAHGALGNQFARNKPFEHGAGRSGGQFAQGYDQNAATFARNNLEESVEPANYNFGYMVNDYQEGTDFGHHEAREEETAKGEYHVVLPDGRKQTVSYEADERGFKPRVFYQDSEDLVRANGYDANANNVRGFHGDHSNHGNSFNGASHHGNHGNGY